MVILISKKKEEKMCKCLLYRRGVSLVPSTLDHSGSDLVFGKYPDSRDSWSLRMLDPGQIRVQVRAKKGVLGSQVLGGKVY